MLLVHIHVHIYYVFIQRSGCQSTDTESRHQHNNTTIFTPSFFAPSAYNILWDVKMMGYITLHFFYRFCLAKQHAWYIETKFGNILFINDKYIHTNNTWQYIMSCGKAHHDHRNKALNCIQGIQHIPRISYYDRIYPVHRLDRKSSIRKTHSTYTLFAVTQTVYYCCKI